MFRLRERKSILLISMIIPIFISGCIGILRTQGISLYEPKPLYLRCEYRVNPLGIDEVKPRLSWILTSSRRAQKQVAYQVLVATSRDKLNNDQGDLWNSGKVRSDETTCIIYGGKPLTSGMECFWKIRIWGGERRPSQWSKPAMWTMGLLQDSNWQAKWIGFDKLQKSDCQPLEIKEAKWIWYPDFNEAGQIKPGQRLFRRTFEISNENIVKARCFITADDSFQLFVNGHLAGTSRRWDSLKEIIIKDHLRKGKNTIAVSAVNGGAADSLNPAGLVAFIEIEYADGSKFKLISDDQWKSSDKAENNWQLPSFDDTSWKGSARIGAFGCGPWGQLKVNRILLPPAKYSRKQFTTEKKIKKAYLYATAFGLYQIHINGQRVGEDYFSPGWTDYTKRIYYRTYDVTGLLRKGENTLGAILADGWYAGYVGYGGQRNHYGQKLRLLAQLCIEYIDGTMDVVATDESWKASFGPILEADFLMGETYDAREEMPGWDKVGFDDSKWSAVQVGAELNPKVQAAVTEPVVAFVELKPKKITKPVPGCYIFDMGQNFAGVAKIKIRGKKGQKMVLRYAERLNPDGTIYTANLRRARATDTYICKGKGVELWQPYFTFHGFQYVELTGLSYKPDKNTVTGIALSSDIAVTGDFECSNKMVNQLYSNIVWTQRANFIDIPTDCPQRDERLGWTGDAQVFVRTACMNTDVQSFFSKWLTDLRDAQTQDGRFPKFAPARVPVPDSGPAWADAGVICPWTIYEVYGDKRLLEQNYEAMKKFVQFCKNRCTPELLPPAEFHCYGDWLNIDDPTPKDVVYMAYFACSTKLVAKAANVLGKKQDAEMYNELFESIKKSFNKAYVAQDGKIKGDSQTAYVIAIKYDLLNEGMQRIAAERLIEKIKKREWHLSTGFVGTKDLMLVLSKIGRNDVAYRLLLNETFPSWGFSIKQGATSIWERWNGWTPEDGFADPGMNSFAHYAFGAVGQWMFENIGGIRADKEGFEQIIIRPSTGGNLKFARTAYSSIRGMIESQWHLKGNDFRLKLSIPANTSAMVYVLTVDPQTVTEGGKPAEKAEGVTFIGTEKGCAVYKVLSGTYDFSSKISAD